MPAEIIFTEEQFNIFFEKCTDSLVGSGNYYKMKAALEKHGYLITKEEPFIIHNVMSYKGKNYLAFKVETMRCSYCKLDGTVQDESCYKFYKCPNGCFWKEFEDVNISDHLACMRKDIGDIYVIVESIGLPSHICKLIYVNQDNEIVTMPYVKGKVRLTTAEELQEYFE